MPDQTSAMISALAWPGIGVRTLCRGHIEPERNTEFMVADAGRAAIRRVPGFRVGLAAGRQGLLLSPGTHPGRFIAGSETTAGGGHTVFSL